MMCCAYCDQRATLKIVACPDKVCAEHALEFWNGLMAYVRDHAEPCVREGGLCSCRSCEELGAAYTRARAIAAAGPSPADHEPFRIRLAS